MHFYLIKNERTEGFSTWGSLFCLFKSLCFLLVVWVQPIAGQNDISASIKYELLQDESKKFDLLRFNSVDSSAAWKVYLSGAKTPMVGSKRRISEGFEFRPLAGFQSGSHYEVRQNGRVLFSFVPQEGAVTIPKVLAVYPSGERVPQNLLKLYVHFSEPMSSASPYPFISLLNGERDTLHDVFLLQEPPLWNKDRTQLTLWLDPGRIKTDLELNRRFGVPLQANQTYYLLISSTMKSARGVALQIAVEKTWMSEERDERSPQPRKWQIGLPSSQGLDPLKVVMDEPLDYGSSWGRMQILRSGEAVKGLWKAGTAESVWFFVPEKPWKKGVYRLELDGKMEDLAGNNLIRLFDVNLKKGRNQSRPILELPFSIQK